MRMYNSVRGDAFTTLQILLSDDAVFENRSPPNVHTWQRGSIISINVTHCCDMAHSVSGRTNMRLSIA